MKQESLENYSDESIREFLESCDPIELYCISQPEGSDGLIYSFNIKEGRFYSFLMRDDEFNQVCVDYLKRQNLPVFQYRSDMAEYRKELQEKYKESLEDFREGAMDSRIA